MDEKDSKVVGWRAAAEVAGRSDSWLRRRLNADLLHGRKNANGEWEFERVELEALRPAPSAPAPQRVESDTSLPTQQDPAAEAGGNAPAPTLSAVPGMTPGELAAAVFTELDAGRRLSEVACLLKVPMSEVLRLHEDWKDAALVDTNAPSVPIEIAKLQDDVRSIRDTIGQLTARGDGDSTRLAKLERWRVDVKAWAGRIAGWLEGAAPLVDSADKRLATLMQDVTKLAEDVAPNSKKTADQVEALRARIDSFQQFTNQAGPMLQLITQALAYVGILRPVGPCPPLPPPGFVPPPYR